MKTEYAAGGRKKTVTIMTLLFIAVMCVLTGVTSYAKEEEVNNNRILFISSYSLSRDTVQLEIEGIQSAQPDDFILDYEFMDTYRVYDDTAMQLFYEGLKYRLSQVEEYDAVILGDDAALRFFLKYREELFLTQPAFYIGVNDEALSKRAEKDPNIKGIMERLPVKENLEKALEIYPEAETVYAIVDDSLTGTAESQNYDAMQKEFPDLNFVKINASRLTQEELRKQIMGMPENAILIYYCMNEDAEGRQYTNKEAVNFISLYTKIPILYFLENDRIGENILGGYCFSIKNSATEVMKAAVKVVRGDRKMQYVYFKDSGLYVWSLNADMLKKFQISRKYFPDDTVYVNDVPSFWEKNSEIITPIILIVVVLSAISAWLCLDNVKRRKMMKEMEEMKDHLENASQHDFLTGLPNRSKFMSDLQEIIAKKQPCTVIMLDLDNFKGINDTMGHAMGDEALKGVANRLKTLKTPLLTAYRFAGDEFILILRSDNPKISDNAVMQCLQVFRKPYKMMGKPMDIHGSIGAACYPADTLDMETLIVCADDAMYAIKKEGKNGCMFYRDLPKDIDKK
ncbi:MAG: GGDEF domain-containing protein [Lachnospiraceae bacterium]|jgi:diguanylate cyclase (GGDEF)-like protein|nr:GGDEF domain-containing protein [Lachnospiraceae bacterium]